jgi:hypothetical protein
MMHFRFNPNPHLGARFLSRLRHPPHAGESNFINNAVMVKFATTIATVAVAVEAGVQKRLIFEWFGDAKLRRSGWVRGARSASTGGAPFLPTGGSCVVDYDGME